MNTVVLSKLFVTALLLGTSIHAGSVSIPPPPIDVMNICRGRAVFIAEITHVFRQKYLQPCSLSKKLNCENAEYGIRVLKVVKPKAAAGKIFGMSSLFAEEADFVVANRKIGTEFIFSGKLEPSRTAGGLQDVHLVPSAWYEEDELRRFYRRCSREK